MDREINTDLVSGAIGLIITGVLFFSLEDISRLSIMFPEALIYILAVISSVLIAKGFVKPSRAKIFKEGANTRWVVTGVLFFSWVMAMPLLGFFVATLVFFSLIVCYLASARTSITPAKLMVWLPVVVAETTFFYLIFTRILHVPLPQGLLF